jgi:hypothetical protein
MTQFLDEVLEYFRLFVFVLICLPLIFLIFVTVPLWCIPYSIVRGKLKCMN